MVGAVLAGPTTSTASATDPCQGLNGSTLSKCQKDNPQPTPTPSSDPCKKLSGPTKDACKDANGGSSGSSTSSSSNPLDNLFGDCKSPPMAQSPGQGVMSWTAGGPTTAPAPIDPSSATATSHLYEQYGMAGLQWNTYDLGCGGDVRDPGSSFENWLANRSLDATKWWTDLAVKMQRESAGTGYMSKLNPVFSQATKAVRDAVYTPWIGTSIVLLGCVLLFQARAKNLPGLAQAIGWAALVMVVTTFAFSYPTQAGSITDTAMTQTIGRIQQGVAGDPDHGSDPQTSEGNLLVGSIIYQQWLDGEFGCSDCSVAKKYGMQLYDTQALTWAESRLPTTQKDAVIAAKAAAFKDIASKVQKEDPVAYGYLTGHTSGRLWASFIAALAAIPANSYSIAASIVLACARTIIKLLVVFAPAVAPIAIHRRMAGTAQTLGKSAAAAVINAPLFCLAAALDVLFNRALISSTAVPQWFAVVLLYVLTAILWSISKPFRSLTSMVSPNRNWAGDGVGTLSRAKAAVVGGALGYAKGRWNARQIGKWLKTNGTAGSEDDAVAPNTVAEEQVEEQQEETPVGQDLVLAGRGWPRDDEAGDQAGAYGYAGPDGHPGPGGGGFFVPGGAGVPGQRTRAEDLDISVERVPAEARPARSGPMPRPPAPARRTLPSAPPAGSPPPSGDVPYRGGPTGPVVVDAPAPSSPPSAVIEPTTAEDGSSVYVVFTPTNGYAIHDDRGPHSGTSTPDLPEDGNV
ncbi:hypothetical protein RVR_P220 (plasmid) [Actinacidiphila reveromycinica]|uniref:Uncharacterized protein n=1 Tax=Actinacidiphila reveromycinica TaxID=659352 RepID=A0A7U3LGB4_9ACTN|nr:hypothetical protein RVR_P220 [Streptomyces sp. SN-593]